jgi:uncharacterized protein YciI
MIRARFIAVGSLLALAVAALGQDAAPKATILVIYRPGPAWLAGKPASQQPLKEHGQYLLSLYEKGTLKSGGPFMDDRGGAAVIEAADVTAAEQIIDQDPAVKNRIFLYELHPWGLVRWDNWLKK